MLTIIDLNRNEELSPRRMAEVVGGLDDIPGGDGDSHKDWSEVTGYTQSSPVTMADLWNKMFGSIAPV
jgi:hypothetical protein